MNRRRRPRRSERRNASAAAHRAAGERAVRWARNALTVLVLVWALSVVVTGVLAASTVSPELHALVVHARRSEVRSELMVGRDGVMLLAACLLAVPVVLAVGGDVLTRRAHVVVRQDVRQRVSPLSVAAVTVAVLVAPDLVGSVAASTAGPQGGDLLEWVAFWPYVALVPALVVWHHAERAPDVARAAALARSAT